MLRDKDWLCRFTEAPLGTHFVEWTNTQAVFSTPREVFRLSTQP